MQRHSDESSNSFTLQTAELNPLLNPLLAEHMGQWAEVYFTSPPEQREEAVLALLQELKADGSERGSRSSSRPDTSINSAASANTAVSNMHASDSRVSSETAGGDSIVYCVSCGRRNPVLHRFCGTCGGPLNAANAAVAENTSVNISEKNSEHKPEAARRETSGIDDIRAKLDPQRRAFEESVAHPHELSLFRSFREAGANDDLWEEPETRRRPIYIGVVLAILIAGLAYMGWRSVQLTAQRAKLAQTPVRANDNAPAAAGPSPSNSIPQPSATRPEARPATAAPQIAKASPARIREVAVQKPSAQAALESSRAQTFIDNGSEELTVAQRYLNGANGQPRDPAEAARWLWKSISKQNGAATLLLADLYLKGDGVSKNCDQARVLLDSAGRKGVAGADTRLRNLQAFGCQ